MGCDKSKPEVQQTTTIRDEIPEYKVIVIGDSAVGKTAIIH
jgi:GTPase SAR1 family protein